MSGSGAELVCAVTCMCLVQTQAGQGSAGVTEEELREWITTSSSASHLCHLGQITSAWSEILFSLIQT